MTIPVINDAAVNVNDSFVPLTSPVAYAPAKGDVGVKINGAFVPLEPYGAPTGSIAEGSYPLLHGTVYNDFTFPYTSATGSTCAIADVSPFDRANNETAVLDTVSDAMATPAEKALPGYIANPGLSLRSKTHSEFDLTKYDDADGVAYLWNLQPVQVEVRWVKIDKYSGRLFVRGPRSTDVVTINNAVYPTSGVLLLAQTNLAIRLSGAAGLVWVHTVNFNETGKAANNVYLQGTTGIAPPSYVTHYCCDYYGLPNPPTEWPHPALRAGQTQYVYATPAAIVGTVYDKPFSPQASGLLRTQAYHAGMLLSYSTAPTTPIKWSNWSNNGGQTSVGIGVVAKIGKLTATWLKASTSLTIASATTDSIIRYQKASDPAISSQTAFYGGTSCYWSSSANPNLTNGDKILLTGTTPLNLPASAYNGLTAEYTVRDCMSITSGSPAVTVWYFNLATSTAGAAVQPFTTTSGMRFYRRYSAALTLSQNETVTFYAEKGGMINSDLFQIDTGPAIDDFTTYKFSQPPNTAYVNNITDTVLTMQKPANYYVSPGATGDGLTPSTPGSMRSIVGAYGVWNTSIPVFGPARGAMCFLVSQWGTVVALYGVGDFQTAGAGADKLYYGINTAPNTLYNGVNITLTGFTELQFEARASNGTTKISPVYKQICTGSSAQPITATWTQTTGMLALTGAPAGCTIKYAINGSYLSKPDTTYTGPIHITVPTTYDVMVEYEDFTSLHKTTVTTVTAIDPAVTADFVQTLANAWSWTVTGNQSHSQIVKPADIIWCSEGTYDTPVDEAGGVYFLASYAVRGGVVLRGGYNSSFTARNTAVYKSVIHGQTRDNPDTLVPGGNTGLTPTYCLIQYPCPSWADIGLTTPRGLVDGFHFTADLGHRHGAFISSGVEQETYRRATLCYGETVKDCHVDITDNPSGGGAYAWAGFYLTCSYGLLNAFNGINSRSRFDDCTVDYDCQIGAGEDGSTATPHAGGCYVTALTFAGTPGTKAYNCISTMNIRLGKGGDGKEAELIPYGGGGIDLTNPGIGGDCRFASPIDHRAIYDGCTVNATIVCDGGGIGGAGNAGDDPLDPPPYLPDTHPQRGIPPQWGGVVSAVVEVGTATQPYSNCTVNVNINAGDGGAGGAGTGWWYVTWSWGPGPGTPGWIATWHDSGPGVGGATTATATTTPKNSNTETVYTLSGTGGDGVVNGNTTSTITTSRQDNRTNNLTMSAVSGDAGAYTGPNGVGGNSVVGNTTAWVFAAYQGYRNVVKATATCGSGNIRLAYVRVDRYPTFFTPTETAEWTLSETLGVNAQNWVRYSPNWYGGTIACPGLPAPYNATHQSGGYILGKYFD